MQHDFAPSCQLVNWIGTLVRGESWKPLSEVHQDWVTETDDEVSFVHDVDM